MRPVSLVGTVGRIGGTGGIGTAVVAVALALALGGCGGDGGSSVSFARAERFRAAALGVCEAHFRAQPGAEETLARTAFYDRAHDVLHEIARDTQEIDRAAAARLLEAKQRVEAALDAEPRSVTAEDDLAALLAATRAALAVLSIEVGACV